MAVKDRGRAAKPEIYRGRKSCQLNEGKMMDGITIRVLGDYGPFSRMGKSIGYQVTIGQSSYLVDCGSPLPADRRPWAQNHKRHDNYSLP